MKKILIVVLLAIAFCPHADAQLTGFHIIHRFPVSAVTAGWDYLAVSPVAPELYVSHGTQVNILDKITGDSVGIIPNTPGVHGIAFAPEFGKGYTSNGRANTISVFDLKTHAVTGEIAAGENPDAIMYDPFSKTVIVCNGRSNNLTIIDVVSGKVLKTIPIGGKPETAVTDGAGTIFVNIEDKNEVAVVDAVKWEVNVRYTIGDGTGPAGLAIDRITHRLFVGCTNFTLVILDAQNGQLLRQLPIGKGCDGVAFDPGLKYIYCANGSGTLTIVEEHDTNEFVLLENVPTQKSARTLAVDESTHTIYLPAAEFQPQKPEEVGKKRPILALGTLRVLVLGR